MSYPAQAAGVLGWDFVKPNFPQPVLFDLEEIVRDYLELWRLEDLLKQLQKNLDTWPSHLELLVFLLGLARQISRDKQGRALRPQEQSIVLEWAHLFDAFRWTTRPSL